MTDSNSRHRHSTPVTSQHPETSTQSAANRTLASSTTFNRQPEALRKYNLNAAQTEQPIQTPGEGSMSDQLRHRHADQQRFTTRSASPSPADATVVADKTQSDNRSNVPERSSRRRKAHSQAAPPGRQTEATDQDRRYRDRFDRL